MEGRSHLTSSTLNGENALPGVCYRLAADRINLNYVTHMADIGNGDSATALCTENADSFSSYFLLKVDRESVVKLESDMSILSIFPHDQKPHVPGALMELLAKENIRVQGFASSPSAMSVLVSSMDTGTVIDGLFDAFEFPTYHSPYDWHAAYKGKEQVLKEIICSYQEPVIKVYNILQQPDLDLWSLAVPHSRLDGLGTAMKALDGMGIKLPFLVAHPGRQDTLLCAFCFAGAHCEQVGEILAHHLPEVKPVHRTNMVAISLHGPHFGDRYGITNSLVGALHSEAIRPMAMSCAISSISVVVRAEDLESAMRGLNTSFQVPG